jgi:hypothetical protein
MMRPLAGACSSFITTILLYPLDVRKAYAHVNVMKPVSYKGVAWDACGSFAATFAYFDTYERFLTLYGVPPAAAVAVSVSSLIASPIGTIVRRRQLTEESQTLTLRKHLNVYMLTVSRNMPKAIVKYTVYEWVCIFFGANVANVVRGLVGGICASVVSTILFAPMDYWKTCLSVQKHPRWREAFQGCTNAFVYSVMSNGLGHAILELLSPRHSLHLIRT